MTDRNLELQAFDKAWEAYVLEKPILQSPELIEFQNIIYSKGGDRYERADQLLFKHPDLVMQFHDYDYAKTGFYFEYFRTRKEIQLGEDQSQSGRYKVRIETLTPDWGYCKACIQDTERGTEQIVYRNYHWWHTFVEGHPNGHDYLVCGDDYQGQTVIELDTGRQISYYTPRATMGFGFCWYSCEPSASKTLLAVSGCIWGGPDENLILDFSDPMNGMPTLYIVESKCPCTEIKWHNNEDACTISHYTYVDDDDIGDSCDPYPRKIIQTDIWTPPEPNDRPLYILNLLERWQAKYGTTGVDEWEDAKTLVYRVPDPEKLKEYIQRLNEIAHIPGVGL